MRDEPSRERSIGVRDLAAGQRANPSKIRHSLVRDGSEMRVATEMVRIRLAAVRILLAGFPVKGATVTAVDEPGELTVAAILVLADEAAQGSIVDVPVMWKHGGGIFGGFTSSLALATAARLTGFGTIAGAQVMFAKPTEPGPLTIEVEVLHRGRSSAAVQVRAQQQDIDRVVLQTWLVSEPMVVGERQDLNVPPPEDCPDVTCWDEALPFMRAIDERAIDYPLSIESFAGGPPVADLWVRAASTDALVNSLAGQLLEVVALDTHLVDAAIRPQPAMGLSSVLSLDLNVWWSCTTPTEWRRIRVEAPGQGNRLTPILGTIWSPDGAVRARASQVARFSSKRT